MNRLNLILGFISILLSGSKATSPLRYMCLNYEMSRCEEIVSYNASLLPNQFGHFSSEEVLSELSTYFPLIDSNCSPALFSFLCIVFLPECHEFNDIVPPCQSYCEAAKEGCQDKMKEMSLTWPSLLDCNLFPSKNCIELPGKVTVVIVLIPAILIIFTNFR